MALWAYTYLHRLNLICKFSEQKVLGTYQIRHHLHNVQLHFNGNAVAESELIGAFLTPGENLVVFVASDLIQADAQDPALALLSKKHFDSEVNGRKCQDHAPGHPEAHSAQAMAERESLGNDIRSMYTPSRRHGRCSPAPRNTLGARHNRDSNHTNDSVPVSNQTSVKDELTLSPLLNSSLFQSFAEQRATGFDSDSVFRHDSSSEVSSQKKADFLNRNIWLFIELQDSDEETHLPA
ncbi:Nuclear GTPase SLIP-GC [Stemphylium lycopersici]|nr:Nuclear GTPase SLIP-GC [Stemphylium lycopersici]